jgi:hypothetical protein
VAASDFCHIVTEQLTWGIYISVPIEPVLTKDLEEKKRKQLSNYIKSTPRTSERSFLLFFGTSSFFSVRESY